LFGGGGTIVARLLLHDRLACLFVCLLCPLINISLLFGGGGTIVARSRPGRRGLLLHGIVDGRLFQTLVLLLILGRIHAKPNRATSCLFRRSKTSHLTYF
jgi:hypothetical protein